MPLRHEIPLDPGQAALLFMNGQNFRADGDRGEIATLHDEPMNAKYGGPVTNVSITCPQARQNNSTATNRDCWWKIKTDDLVREIREVSNG
ncbi:MAG: hypothetical protein AB3N20_01480 [Rhizobiaceae bacterium]